MKNCKYPCNNILKYGIIGLAILVAALALIIPKAQLYHLAPISQFFEIMLPFLGVGALIKYLCCGAADCK